MMRGLALALLVLFLATRCATERVFGVGADKQAIPEGVDEVCLLREIARLRAGSGRPPASVDDLESTGVHFYQPEGTTCATGEPFAFGVQYKSTSLLRIHFLGGTVCYTEAGCCRNNKPSTELDSFLSVNIMAAFACGLTVSKAQELAVSEFGQELDGLFAERPDNPLVNYTTIIAAFCTADLWLGAGSADYGSCNVHHNGTSNGRAVMQWALDVFGDTLTDLVITGESAGLYGSLYHGAWALKQLQDDKKYPSAAWFGDCGVGILTAPLQWRIPDGIMGRLEFLGVDVSSLAKPTGVRQFGDVHRQMLAKAAETFPCTNFLEFTTDRDENQVSFAQNSARRLLNCGPELCGLDFVTIVEEDLQRSTKDVGAYYACLTRATYHVIMSASRFYNETCTSLNSGDVVDVRTWFTTSSRRDVVCATPSPTTSPSGSPPGLGEGNDACFPESAIVVLESGKSVQMKELRVGDSVMTSAGTFDKIFTFGHRDVARRSKFTRLTLEDGSSLLVSPKHILFANNDEMLRAADTRPGDLVLKSNGSWVQIARISEEFAVGLYNPHTLGGSISVNYVVVSCFTSFSGFPEADAKLAHYILAPIRWTFRILGVNALGTSLHPSRAWIAKLGRLLAGLLPVPKCSQ
eukprot:Plantae.Rhodophyta-Rhodochaete_pulchella.ctg489.p1 GENE.Plantae.Rhodophyta-Rhodochaete_pulchella.ctg489~~Plantae.Rhodophyta-Rhodochaete_pulchella.ctg489.p1  ORF type:complete len:635 (-),score=76.24 Plantae.Rhodophyta-Rhodochaete_pulchella.ctg489:2189-4093(-)